MNNSSKSNTDIGTQDLLFSGAASFIVLFLIFAIRIGGNSIIESVSRIDNNSRFMARNSLVDEYSKDGSMQSVRIVELSGLSTTLLSVLFNKPTIGQWDLQGFDLDEISRIKQQIYITEESISYVLVLDSLNTSSIEFNLDYDEISEEIRDRDKMIRVRAKIIEGESMVFSSNPITNIRYNGFTKSPEHEIELDNSLRVEFHVDEVDKTHNLFEIIKES